MKKKGFLYYENVQRTVAFFCDFSKILIFLLDLNNGVLFQSLNEQIESNHYNILSDLAAASFNETHNDNEDEGTSHMEDDDNDSPWNCVLYGKGKCLY